MGIPFSLSEEIEFDKYKKCGKKSFETSYYLTDLREDTHKKKGFF